MSSNPENTQALNSNQSNREPHVCPWWVAYLFDNPIRRLVHPADKLLGAYVQPGMRVMDFGCGFGHFSLGMAKLVHEIGVVYAVDIQEKMLVKTGKRAARSGLDRIIKAVKCESQSTGVDDELDFILACNALHETPNPEMTLLEFFSLLKPGGQFLLMEPPGHLKADEFEEEVALAIKSGFTEVSRPAIRREMTCLFEVSKD